MIHLDGQEIDWRSLAEAIERALWSKSPRG
jgi:hypothetical protein